MYILRISTASRTRLCQTQPNITYMLSYCRQKGSTGGSPETLPTLPWAQNEGAYLLSFPSPAAATHHCPPGPCPLLQVNTFPLSFQANSNFPLFETRGMPSRPRHSFLLPCLRHYEPPPKLATLPDPAWPSESEQRDFFPIFTTSGQSRKGESNDHH